MKIKFLDGTEKEFANLRNADLQGADLRHAYLLGADLRDANLREANLQGANLQGANLRGANLQYADLRGANLQLANLYGANLQGAYLRDADLRGANLYGANLRGANLRGADLRDANLRGAKGLEQQCILPAGVIIGYKKLASGAIAKLRIPANAARINAYGSRKCRAEYVIVISGTGTDGHTATKKYAPGKKIKPDKFDPDPCIECSHGIHFFITEQEAKDY